MTTNTQILWPRSKEQQHVCAPDSETVGLVTETLLPLQSKRELMDVEKCLSRRSLIRMVGDHSGEKISCLSGVVWITQSGNPEDFLTCAGETFDIIQKGTVVIQGLVTAHVKITNLNVK